MKIFVLGGSNFIGWRLVQYLGNTGNEVTVYNRGNHERIYPKNVIHVIGDRTDTAKLLKLAENNYDVVYDMCAFTGAQIKPTIECFKNKVGRYVFISSAAAYLDNQILPIKEDAMCGEHPQWGKYGNGKYECELLLKEAYNEYNFPITIVRPSYVYGIGNPIDRETLLFDRISKSLPIFIPYSGYGVIQLGNVDDLCNALYLIACSNKGKGESYNISGEEYVTLNGLVRIIEDIVGKKTNIYHVLPEKYGFAQREIFPFENNTYFTSIQKFKNDFDWKPTIGLLEGLKQAYLHWCKAPIKTNYTNEEKLAQILKGNGTL
ncbi:MAG: NAD-dependent epimerase/dehydratase family protein [Clostridia bacterium]|nr:NAD-dependent epimerase/dehydratase family protein [Clostridia bacterium]